MKSMPRTRRLLLGTLLAIVGSAGMTSVAQAVPPQISAVWVTDVGASSARLRTTVNPEGSPTTARFEYITAAAYQANLAAAKDGFAGALKAPVSSNISIGSGTAPVTPPAQQLSGLKASTAYRYRLVATNQLAETAALARSFATTETAPVFALPDNRGWEMVSPVDKNGGAIEGPEANFGGGVLQASAQGDAVTYTSASSFANATGSPGASQYVSRRVAGGWTTENITLPLLSGGYGDEPDGVPYQLFSPDLTRALHHDSRRCAEAQPCVRTYSLRQSDGSLVASPAQPDLRFAGANPSLSHVLLVGADLYRWSGGSLEPINVEPGETTPSPGAALAAQGGAVSADGTRVYWTVDGNLYLRDGAESVQVDEALGGGAQFETASDNGSVAYLSKENHLYRYLAGPGTLTDLTPGGGVQGTLGTSADGTRVYYLSGAGLFHWRGGTTTEVAPAAASSNYPPTTGTARVSGDGQHLVFLSAAALTDYDNNGETEVYLYTAASDSLTCVSCNPTGERPLGPSTIPGAFANGTAYRAYKPRALSADGRRVYFDSFDALVSQDTNHDRDVYQWQAQGSGTCAKAGGCVNLISSGRSEDGATFIDASATGADVFFTTDGSLVPSDPGSTDLYDARVGGGFPVPVPPIPCVADACQPLPPEPEDPTPGTLLVRPNGNPPLSFTKTGKKKGNKKKAKAGKGKGGKKGKAKKKGSKRRAQRRSVR